MYRHALYARFEQAIQTRDGSIEGTWAHQVAQSIEEQLREDKQELRMWEQKKKVRMQRGHEGSFMITTRVQEQITCKMKMGNSCIMTNRHCSVCDKAPKVDGLTLS